MADPEQALVDGIRAASRQMVRELGFMQATLAATDYPASAVHALIELGKHGSMSAAAIAACLGLDKSSVSRMLRKLVDAGELTETVSDHDGRIKNLSLTARGRRTLAAVEAYGRRQVEEALQHMAPEARDWSTPGSKPMPGPSPRRAAAPPERSFPRCGSVRAIGLG